MPEACFLCLDSTEFMRNGDQFPNRFLVMQEAASLLVNAKIQMNAENTVGFLTLGGNACTVFETLTQDVDRVMATLTKIPISGKQCHFSKGLQIACLALSHRTNPRAEKRVVAFIGTPLTETDEELDKLARKLRKDDVAVDVVAVGVELNVPRLSVFVEKLSKQGNSRFLNVQRGSNLVDALMSSPILLGGDGGVGGGGDAAQNEYLPFGIDPTMDPELAMALRMSLEEEQQRQAAGGNNNNTNTTTTTTENNTTSASGNNTGATPGQVEDPENMSEEEMIALALRMSLEESKKGSQGQQQERSDTTAMDEEAFLRELQSELHRQENSNVEESKKNEEDIDDKGPEEDKK